MDIRLTKHHGLGNDFLVVDLAQGTPPIAWAELARQWCDRRFGVGADGLLLLDIQGPQHLSMVLFNADGSRAEMSGNGIRCLVQAAHRQANASSSLATTYTVKTDAGQRIVRVEGGDEGETLQISVEMGQITDLDEPQNWSELQCNPDRPVRHLSLGNPHAVVGVDDLDDVDLQKLGALVPQVNLEIIAVGPEIDAITMRVHERGAGITLACGTGACAAAEAALAWGLVPASTPEVIVHMAGGDARVRIDLASRTATLVGPSVFIASLSVHV